MSSLHGKIAAELRQQITSGLLGPGDFLPTEAQLADHYGVSRNTIKTATAALTNAGLVERVPGRHGGMRVRQLVMMTHYASRADNPAWPAGESDTFVREVREQGMVPTQRLRVEVVALTAEVAQRLEVEEGTRAVLRHCLRFINDVPSSIQATFYPRWLTDELPDLLSPQDIPIGTTRFLKEHGHEQVAFIDETISRMPTSEEVAMLNLVAGTPILEHIRTGLTRPTAVRVTFQILNGFTNRLVTTLGDPVALRRALESDE